MYDLALSRCHIGGLFIANMPGLRNGSFAVKKSDKLVCLAAKPEKLIV
jgi:hypothetical protein